MSPKIRELTRFGLVGALAYLVDAGGFNLLVHFPGAPLQERPLTAKIISTSLAIACAYFGNREWTWRDRERTRLRREFSLFVILNLIALIIAVVVLATSRYVLGYDSALADNISGNIIGVGLGTLFRYWSYQRWIFRPVIGVDFSGN